MTASRADPHRLAAKVRMVACVLVGTMLIWLAVQWMGGRLGWPQHYVFLFDLAAIAAFVWAMVVTWQIWRQRRN